MYATRRVSENDFCIAVGLCGDRGDLHQFFALRMELRVDRFGDLLCYDRRQRFERRLLDGALRAEMLH